MSDMALDLRARRFTVGDYHRMSEAGLFEAEPLVELLGGTVVEMSPIGHSHALLHARIVRYLTLHLNDRAAIFGQISLVLDDFNEPHPDIAILVPSALEASASAPKPADILAIVEIAASSLTKDTGTKRQLYARSGVGDYLVVDVEQNALLHFSNPQHGAYVEATALTPHQTFEVRALREVALEAGPFLRTTS